MEQLYQHAALIETLTREYETLYIVNLITGEYETCRMSPAVWNRYGSAFSDRFEDTVRAFCAAGVFAQDEGVFIQNLTLPRIRFNLRSRTEYSFIFRALSRTGTLWHRGKVARLGSSEGELTSALVGFANVNEDQMREERQRNLLEAALEHAKHAEHAKNVFLAGMSHDIRTPMNSVMGYAKIASANLGNEEKVRLCLERILESSGHLLDLIDEILDFSRIESGRGTLDETSEEFLPLLDGICDMVLPSVAEKGLHFERKYDDQLPAFVYCDRLRIAQFLLNLLNNAVKYTPGGGHVSLEVAPLADAPRGYVNLLFRVKDDGIGMSGDFLQHAFEPFEREYDSTVSGISGTGLGLSISKSIIGAMGGSLDVESEQGKGSVFTVRIALRLAESEKKRGPESSRSQSGIGAPGSGFKAEHFKTRVFYPSPGRFRIPAEGEIPRLLLVEDNELNREMGAELLTYSGAEVDTAGSGEECLEMLEKTPGRWHAILMDIRMPGISGYETTRLIRGSSDPRTAEIPVIAMTANAFEEDVERARHAGMDAYISKPIDTDALRRIWREIIRK